VEADALQGELTVASLKVKGQGSKGKRQALWQSKALEQSAKRDAQGMSDSCQVTYGRIPHTLFDAPHVGAVHAGLISQILLRPFSGLTELPDPFAERLLHGVCAFRHGTC
jgi:hypothetical protein